jgi:hypothetical protein
LLIDKRKTIIAMFIYLSAAILTRVFAVKNAAWLVGADMDSYISRHFPDSLQVHGDHIQIAPPL